MSSVDLAHSATASHHGIIDKFGGFIDSVLNKIKPYFVKKNEGRAQGLQQISMKEFSSSGIDLTKQLFQPEELQARDKNSLKNIVNRSSKLISELEKLKSYSKNEINKKDFSEFKEKFKTEFKRIVGSMVGLSSRASDCFYEGYVRGYSKIRAHSSPLEKLKSDLMNYRDDFEIHIKDISPSEEKKNEINTLINELKNNRKYESDSRFYEIAKAKVSIDTSIEKIDEFHDLKIKIKVLNKIKNLFVNDKVIEKSIFTGMNNDEKNNIESFLDELGIKLNGKINKNGLSKAMEELKSLENNVSLYEESAIKSVELALKDKLKCPLYYSSHNAIDHIKLPVKATIIYPNQDIDDDTEEEDEIDVNKVYSILNNSDIKNIMPAITIGNVPSSFEIEVSYKSEGKDKTMMIEFNNKEEAISSFSHLINNIGNNSIRSTLTQQLERLKSEESPPVVTP